VNNREKAQILRGDIYYADLNPVVGSEQGGVRPVLIVQNDIGNLYSPTVIVAAITTKDLRVADMDECLEKATCKVINEDTIEIQFKSGIVMKQRVFI